MLKKFVRYKQGWMWGAKMLAQRQTFVELLEATAKTISNTPPEDLKALLMRAALKLRNSKGIDIEPQLDRTLTSLAAEVGMTRAELIGDIIIDWMQSNDFLPIWMNHQGGEMEPVF